MHSECGLGLLRKVLGWISMQPLAFPHELDAFLFEYELLYFPACGFRVVVDPEDVFGYWRFFVSFMPTLCLIRKLLDVPK